MRIVDLTLPINRRMKGLSGFAMYDNNPTRLTAVSVMSDAQRAALEARDVAIAEDVEQTNHMLSRLEILTHIGTHIDAPLHMLEDTWAIDEVPLDRLVGPGIVVPLTDTPDGGMVTADQILKTGVEIDGSAIPILYTGWTERAWGSDAFWANTIYMHRDVADLMVERGVPSVAIDFFPEFPFWRNDVTRPEGQPAGHNHRRLLGNRIIIIQMVTNVAALGDKPFTLHAVPLKLEGLDGSPARVYAVIRV